MWRRLPYFDLKACAKALSAIRKQKRADSLCAARFFAYLWLWRSNATIIAARIETITRPNPRLPPSRQTRITAIGQLSQSFQTFFAISGSGGPVFRKCPTGGAMSDGHGGDRINLHRDGAQKIRGRTVEAGDRLSGPQRGALSGFQAATGT